MHRHTAIALAALLAVFAIFLLIMEVTTPSVEALQDAVPEAAQDTIPADTLYDVEVDTVRVDTTQ